MTEKVLKGHPCFEAASAASHGRVHLPVAPECNIQCKFCLRKFDCVNESRPGVTSAVLKPAQAAAYLKKVLEERPEISTAGIAGPGDPLANPETFETIALVKGMFPKLNICVSTNGLLAAESADTLSALGVTHIAVTVSASAPETAAKIYSWAMWKKRIYRGAEAARLMAEKQMEGLRALKAKGIPVKVNTILIPGVNEDDILNISRAAAEAGAELQNIIPLIPVPGTEFEGLAPAPSSLVEDIRAAAEKIIPQMRHCARCRSDACGLLSEKTDTPRLKLVKYFSEEPARPAVDSLKRPFIAVTSHEGLLINMHLGEADRLWIFKEEDGVIKRVETRPAPPAGGGPERWKDMAETLHDCRALLTAQAGEPPVKALAGFGLEVIIAGGFIAEAASDHFAGRGVRSPSRPVKCRRGCAGTGAVCGA